LELVGLIGGSAASSRCSVTGARRRKTGVSSTTAEDDGRRAPQLYLFPVQGVQQAQKPESTWGNVFLRDIPGVEDYIDNWALIGSFLGR
jgi:hypothetical protein